MICRTLRKIERGSRTGVVALKHPVGHTETIPSCTCWLTLNHSIEERETVTHSRSLVLWNGGKCFVRRVPCLRCCVVTTPCYSIHLHAGSPCKNRWSFYSNKISFVISLLSICLYSEVYKSSVFEASILERFSYQTLTLENQLSFFYRKKIHIKGEVNWKNVLVH